MVHVPSISALEDVGYRVLFGDGQVLYSEGATLDVVVDFRKGQSYRFLGQPMSTSEGILDTRTMPIVEREQLVRKSGYSSTANFQEPQLV